MAIAPRVLITFQFFLLVALLGGAAVAALLKQADWLSVSLLSGGASLAVALFIQLASQPAAKPLVKNNKRVDYGVHLRLLRTTAEDEPARVAAVIDHWLDGQTSQCSPEQAAMVLMALEAKVAASVMREFSPERIQILTSYMATLATPDAGQLAQLLARFNDDMLQFSLVRPSQAEDIRDLLEEALGEERAALVKGNLALQGQSQQIAKLKWLAADTIADMLRREHPQIQAVLIACLEPAQGAAVITCFDPQRRRELLSRLASLQSLSTAALAELDWLIEEYLNARGHSGRRLTGESLAAALLNELDVADESALLEGLREYRPGLAERVEDQMFGFEQLQRLTEADMKSLVAQLNPQTALRALDGATGELRAALQDALQSQHPEERLPGPPSSGEVELAKQELVAAAKRLAGVGEIVLDSRKLSLGN
ncbi:FliG C-terminal domain-containing protein [Spongiibacter marinus]|uniref:FliG C-terminal domain-containing protein n=1 Tax=Spongiibacter marinus TaxID=354246 RepID=UPI0003FFA919|nr:FliG C-terminal domain-containing protein [Spongiibacter marinus]